MPHISTDDGVQVHVQRTDDASVVTPTLPKAYVRSVAYGWADDDHLLVAAAGETFSLDHVVDVDLLTCEISSGTCVREEQAHAYLATFNLPLGEPSGRLTKSLLPR